MGKTRSHPERMEECSERATVPRCGVCHQGTLQRVLVRETAPPGVAAGGWLCLLLGLGLGGTLTILGVIMGLPLIWCGVRMMRPQERPVWRCGGCGHEMAAGLPRAARWREEDQGDPGSAGVVLRGVTWKQVVPAVCLLVPVGFVVWVRWFSSL